MGIKKLSKAAVVFFGLPLFFLASNSRSFLGAESEILTAQMRSHIRKLSFSEEASISEEECEALIDEAMNQAEEQMASLYVFDGINFDREYVNFLQGDDGTLEDYSYAFQENMASYFASYPEAEETLSEYSYLDTNLSNLQVLSQNGFSVSEGNLPYEEDFVCDKGMVDFLREKNGGFDGSLGLGTPDEILNPEYLEVYSVYEEESEDTEEEEEETLSSLMAASPAVRRTAAVATATLTTVLLNQGLSYAAAETVKGSFLAIRAAVRYWLPWAARLAIVALSILALTVVFVTYWTQIKSIVTAIVDMFVSVAGSFAAKVRELFASVTKKASDSEGELSFKLNGKTSRYRLLTEAYAKSLSSYGMKDYHRAIRFGKNDTFIPKGFDIGFVYVCVNSIPESEAIAILQEGSTKKLCNYFNTYTFYSSSAKSVMKKAYPGLHVYNHINKTGHGLFLWHYHAGIYLNEYDDYEHDEGAHSFYGLPVYIDN